jgi:molybdate transport system substrate-binding protein
MKIHFAWRMLMLAPLALLTTFAQAAEIRVVSTIGVKMALPEILAEFERASGHKVTVTYGTAAVLKKDILDGKISGDVSILTGQVIEDLLKEGRLAPGSRVDLVRSGSGFGFKAGGPKPDVSTADALKKTLLAAKSIGYSPQGATGSVFIGITEKLGIANEVKPKLVGISGVVGELVAKGEIEIGVQQIPELMDVPGVALAGPFPPEFQVITTFSTGLDAKAGDVNAAKALINFLTGPAAAKIYKSKGLDPVEPPKAG